MSAASLLLLMAAVWATVINTTASVDISRSFSMRIRNYNYTIFETKHQLDWKTAEASCKANGEQLATLKYADSIKELNNNLTNLKIWKAWVGLRKLPPQSSKQSWQWLDGTGNGIIWATGEPDDEDCGMLRPENGNGLSDKSCDDKIPGFICQKRIPDSPAHQVISKNCRPNIGTSTNGPCLCDTKAIGIGALIGIAVGVGVLTAVLLTSAVLLVIHKVKRRRNTHAIQVPTFTYHSYMDQQRAGDSMSDAERTFTENDSLYNEDVTIGKHSVYDNHVLDALYNDDLTMKNNSIYVKDAQGGPHEYTALDVQSQVKSDKYDPHQGTSSKEPGACRYSKSPKTNDPHSNAMRGNPHVYTEIQLPDERKNDVAKKNTRRPEPGDYEEVPDEFGPGAWGK